MDTNAFRVDTYFFGARDRYQVPLALSEAGVLGTFSTDFAFSTSGESSIARRLGRRGLLPSLSGTVRNYPTYLLRQKLCTRWPHLFGDARLLNTQFSRKVLNLGLSGIDGLVTYEPYALPMFEVPEVRDLARIVFYYHPSLRLEQHYLDLDADRWGFRRHDFSGRSYSVDSDRAWRSATACMFASTFTMSTVLNDELNAPEATVVPYGVDLPENMEAPPTQGQRYVVFLGTATQRKGLHHLLRAWEHIGAGHSRYTLKIVTRSVDHEMEAFLRDASDVEVILRAPDSEVRQILRNACGLVMPSLYEGFGHVYLEALVNGCPVLGTERTCLPDLVVTENAKFIARAGDIEDIADKIQLMIDQNERGVIDRRAVQTEIALKYTWQEFRRRAARFVIAQCKIARSRSVGALPTPL